MSISLLRSVLALVSDIFPFLIDLKIGEMDIESDVGNLNFPRE